MPTETPEHQVENTTPKRAVVKGLDANKRPARFGLSGDRLFYLCTLIAGLSVLVFICWIGYQLWTVSEPTRHQFGWGMLLSDKWDINRSNYGAYPFIIGSLITASIALLVGVPLAVGCAI